MKLVKLLKSVAFVASAAMFASSASAEVVALSNGDRISGKVVSANSQSVTVATAFGTVNIPMTQVAKVQTDEQLAAEKKVSEGAKEAAAPVATTPAPAAAPAADPAAPEAKEREIQFFKDYRDFVKQTLPEDLHMRLRGGVQYRETSSSTFSVAAAFDIKQEFDERSSFKATIYYDYAKETSATDVENVTLDKYGVDTDYRVNFDDSKHWYFSNLLSYKVDMVKGIKDQVDEAAVFGYRFDFDRYDLVIDIAPGPAVRYINANGYDTHWVAMAVLNESLVWKLNSLMRFEQSVYAGFNLEKPEEYSVYLKLGLVANVTEVMDIALRYSYEYDKINSSDAQKTEQILTLSFEFPFNWNN